MSFTENTATLTRVTPSYTVTSPPFIRTSSPIARQALPMNEVLLCQASAPGTFSLISPSNGAGGQDQNVDLDWGDSTDAKYTHRHQARLPLPQGHLK